MLEVVSSEAALKLILEAVNEASEPEYAQMKMCDGKAEHGLTGLVPLEKALFCIAAEDILSPEDLPAFARSTVDGFAVHAADTYGCSEAIPAMLICDGEIKMGETPSAPLAMGRCVKISTGGRLPEGSDAVCMVEYSDDIGDEFRYIYKPVSVGENVNRKGDDCRLGSVVLEKGTRIQAKHVAVLAALGISEVVVYAEATAYTESGTKAPVPEIVEIEACRRLAIGVISTGDELVPYTHRPERAQIRDINSVMLAAQIEEVGARPVVYPIVPDTSDTLETAVKKALSQCDMVLISGGSSVGEKDNTFRVLDKLGEIKFHGISIKPGKPTLFAIIDGKPVFGLPGHPQAAFFIYKLFVEPAIVKMNGKSAVGKTRDTEAATKNMNHCKCLTRNIPSNHGREEIIPVRILGEFAEPIYSKSGVVSVLARADGFIRIPRNAEGLKKGEPVQVYKM